MTDFEELLAEHKDMLNLAYSIKARKIQHYEISVLLNAVSDVKNVSFYYERPDVVQIKEVPSEYNIEEIAADILDRTVDRPNTSFEKLQFLISELGRETTFMTIAPTLASNIEIIFIGLVTSYVKFFNKGNAPHGTWAQLSDGNIFKGRPELKEAHKKFMTLRNKTYAHQELEDKFIRFSWKLDENGQVFCDHTDEIQASVHYHIGWLDNLFKCMQAAKSYISNDINLKVKKLNDKLPDGIKEKMA